MTPGQYSLGDNLVLVCTEKGPSQVKVNQPDRPSHTTIATEAARRYNLALKLGPWQRLDDGARWEAKVVSAWTARR